ncbi:MAG TPA: dTDP-4-dehydrorhamnose reductase [bacterium]|nr:dTDP-4-dehydrorhamnose reductase [bacterium]
MKVAITGPDGLLGTELVRECIAAGATVDPLLESECDVTDADALRRRLGRVSPELVIHAAAYTDVNGAEADPDRAYAVNAFGTFHVCRAAEAVGARVVYISTDFVFDGSLGRPYAPDDELRPLQVYGRTKLAGELYVQGHPPGGLVVRTGSLFGPGGAGFPDRFCGQAATGGPLTVVNDRWCSPTYAPDLANAVVVLAGKADSGVFHLTNTGSVTWYDYALHLVDGLGLDVEVVPVGAKEYAAPAPRPARIELDRSAAAGLDVVMRPWDEALADYLDRCGDRLRRSAGRESGPPPSGGGLDG